MNCDELLDRLAMDMDTWPDFRIGEAPPPNVPGLWGTYYDIWECFAKGNTNPILFGHWDKRRKELINSPPDCEAPEWAKWKAQASTGDWYFFEYEPVMRSTLSNTGGWVAESGKLMLSRGGNTPVGHRWQDTLTEVNQVREFNPASSSLTDSQAHEQATEFKTCSDGTACGTPPSIGDDAYCAECPNLPGHEVDARMLDAQLERDIEAFQGLCEGVAAESEQLSPDKHYHHSYKGIKLDPYRIARIYEMRGGPREQIMKKCLRFTDKGQTEQQVINEIRSALKRWQEMLDEDVEH